MMLICAVLAQVVLLIGWYTFPVMTALPWAVVFIPTIAMSVYWAIVVVIIIATLILVAVASL